MKRTLRAGQARDTLSIFEQGFYLAPSGKRISVRDAEQAAVAGTRLYDLGALAPSPVTSPQPFTRLTVTRQTTMEALAELAARPGGSLGCLNFASAKNAGGGFLNGAQAQEESLARSSGLYPCLLAQEGYYARNRAHSSVLYLDLAIFSPGVPFIRNDEGELLENFYTAAVITCPAPNAGAVLRNEPEHADQIRAVLERRSDFVLTIAQREGLQRLVLGAWGCGVFKNDPRMVAQVFAERLGPKGRFSNVFAEVVFAIHDPSPEQEIYRAFETVFTETGLVLKSSAS